MCHLMCQIFYLDFLDLLGDPSLSPSYWLKFTSVLVQHSRFFWGNDSITQSCQTLNRVKQQLKCKIFPATKICIADNPELK